MTFYSLAAYTCFVVFIILFVYIIFLNKRQFHLNSSSAMVCLSLGLWNFFNMFVYSADTKSSAYLWHIPASICMFLFPVFTLDFFVRFTNNRSRFQKIGVRILPYILPAGLIVHSFFKPAFVTDFVLSDVFKVWSYDNSKPSIWYFITLFYLGSYFVLIFIMLYQWQKNSRYKMEKRIAYGFILVDSFVILMGFVTDLFLPLFTSIVPPTANLFTLIFAAFFWFSIRYYHVLYIRHTPSSEKIFHTIIDPIVYTDNTFHIVLINESAKRLFADADRLTGTYLPSLIPEYEDLICSDEKTIDVRLTLADGQGKDLMCNKTAVIDRLDGKTGEIFIFKDITQQVKEEEELKTINQKYAQTAEEMYYFANFDAVTGLHNRENFFRQLTAEKEKADRNESDFALIYMDLNEFKKINDEYGHNTGDIVLQMAASRFMKIKRENDYIARIGGDEFVLIISEMKDDTLLVQRVKELKQIFLEDIAINAVILHSSISAGAALYSQADGSTEKLIHLADAAMYRDKKSKPE